MNTTRNCSAEIDRLRKEIQTADAIVIGAGAGLSTAAGFTYSGERLQKYFADFVEKYGFQDMYSGGFYPFETFEEMWAYWSRYIYINRYMDVDNGTYKTLFELMKDKDISLSPRMSITSSRRQDLTSTACSTRRATTVFGSAVSPVTKRPMTTRKRSERCLNSKKICVFRLHLYRTVPSAANP